MNHNSGQTEPFSLVTFFIKLYAICSDKNPTTTSPFYQAWASKPFSRNFRPIVLRRLAKVSMQFLLTGIKQQLRHSFNQSLKPFSRNFRGIFHDHNANSFTIFSSNYHRLSSSFRKSAMVDTSLSWSDEISTAKIITFWIV